MKRLLQHRPGDRCMVQIGRSKREMVVVSRTCAFDTVAHVESLRLRRGKLQVQISVARR